MVFSHPDMIQKNGSFSFETNVSAQAHECLIKPVIKDFWHGFSFHFSTVEFDKTESLVFRIGDVD